MTACRYETDPWRAVMPGTVACVHHAPFLLGEFHDNVAFPPKKIDTCFQANCTSECVMLFLLPEMGFIICDVISNYKLTNSIHILMVSLRVVSHQSRPVTNHSLTNVRDISVTMTVLQNYIQELVQGIYGKI